MTTPRNSMSGTFQAGPMKGPTAMHPVQKIIPKRMPSVVGPTQNFFMRESKALGVSQLHSILYPRDSLVYRSKCYRPGTECNSTRRYLIQPKVFFCLTQCAKWGIGWEVTTVIYLFLILWFAYLGVSHPSLSPASQACLPWKCPRWRGKWVWTRNGLGTFAMSFRQFTHPQVRARASSLTFVFWLDDDFSSSSVPSFSLQAVQIMNGLFHTALGGLLMIHTDVYAPICITVWYPLWGGIMVSKN